MNNLRQEVYEYLRRIPKGKVVTYGQIAAYFGNPKMARAIGNILHNNPDESRYPCFRVVNSRGELAQKFVFGGAAGQRARLLADGVAVENDRVDLAKYQWNGRTETK
jgi:O-6-methylguanine DNA methyltransferase